MSLNLASVHAKLARAKEHAKTIKSEVSAWCDSRPYSVVPKSNADSTRHSLILRVPANPPFVNWSIVAGDCVHNLRCALDHLVYAIAIHESGQDPPPHGRKLMFPIHSTAKGFSESTNLGTISAPMRAIFESVQPYNRLHNELPPLLSMLSEFDNRDKHRLLNLTFNAVAQGDIGLRAKSNEAVEFIPNRGKLEDGTEVGAFIFTRPTPDVQYDRISIDFVIAIGHGKRVPPTPLGSESNDVTMVLRILTEEVEEVIKLIVAKVTI